MSDKFDEMAEIAGKASGLRREQFAGLAHIMRMLVAEERAACAGVASAHKGSAAAKRLLQGRKFTTMPPEVASVVEAEERGEDIASEIISAAITARALKDSTPREE